MEKAQPIRPTQFIMMYGPGSIIESLRGPRLLLSIAQSGLFLDDIPDNYEIVDPALTKELKGGRIFRLPSNAERELDDSTPIYKTIAFPRWSLCPIHGILYKYNYRSRSRTTCRHCKTAKSINKAWEISREQAIPYVLACRQGHLDDAPWVRLVHDFKSTECNDKVNYLQWLGIGGPLHEVILQCPECKAKRKLSELYYMEHYCRGHYPERVTYKTKEPACTAKARLVQRTAVDLFLPVVKSALTLPEEDNTLFRALASSALESGLRMMLQYCPEPTEEHWNTLLKSSNLTARVRNIIRYSNLDQRNKTAREVIQCITGTSPAETRQHEFEVLHKAATGQTVLRSDNFLVHADGTTVISLPTCSLRVTPISRLRVVMTQIGYRRLNGILVDSVFERAGSRWYPGVELFGEGIFIEWDTPLPDSATTQSRCWELWDQLTRSQEFNSTTILPDKPILKTEFSPWWVWWHTLSHRLIRSLAVDSGYSAASVRERMYVYDNQGGVLLYAVQPGGDGTLGGLIALVPRFQSIIERAFRNLRNCSNDPLCASQTGTSNHPKGAACYACCLLSETACELSNSFLDRNILIETLNL